MTTIYYIYQITNNINNKIYVGVHKTSNMDDGYMGSGTLLKRAIMKYGIENFRKEIIEYFDSEKAMYEKEFKVVNKTFISRPDVYNIVEGGASPGSIGGFLANLFSNAGLKGGQAAFRNNKGWFSPEAMAKKAKLCIGQANTDHLKTICSLSYTSEAIQKKKQTFKDIKHQQGEKNSMYGTMWITNGKENTRIKKGEEIPEDWYKGRVLFS